MFMKNHVIGLEDHNWRDKRDGLKKKRIKGKKWFLWKKGSFILSKLIFVRSLYMYNNRLIILKGVNFYTKNPMGENHEHKIRIWNIRASKLVWTFYSFTLPTINNDYWGNQIVAFFCIWVIGKYIISFHIRSGVFFTSIWKRKIIREDITMLTKRKEIISDEDE